MNTKSTHGESAVPTLTLFVTGNAPRSQRARVNLDAALAALDKASVTPLEVDLIAHPEQTISHSVFATPALIKTADTGETSILYGDLSDEDKLHRFLADIEPAAE